jgi:V/A-type H+-transporting ATPase subunit D
MQIFFGIIEETTSLRREVEEKFLAINYRYIQGRFFSGDQAVKDALHLGGREGELKVEVKYEMGIKIPEYEISFPEGPPVYKLSDSSPSLDAAIEDLYDAFPLLLKLTSKESALMRMSEELEKTRRRVNALEYVLIPDLESSITMIERKLAETERSTQTRLMKIKDMLEA